MKDSIKNEKQKLPVRIVAELLVSGQSSSRTTKKVEKHKNNYLKASGNFQRSKEFKRPRPPRARKPGGGLCSGTEPERLCSCRVVAAEGLIS